MKLTVAKWAMSIAIMSGTVSLVSSFLAMFMSFYYVIYDAKTVNDVIQAANMKSDIIALTQVSIISLFACIVCLAIQLILDIFCDNGGGT